MYYYTNWSFIERIPTNHDDVLFFPVHIANTLTNVPPFHSEHCQAIDVESEGGLNGEKGGMRRGVEIFKCHSK